MTSTSNHRVAATFLLLVVAALVSSLVSTGPERLWKRVSLRGTVATRPLYSRHQQERRLDQEGADEEEESYSYDSEDDDDDTNTDDEGDYQVKTYDDDSR